METHAILYEIYFNPKDLNIIITQKKTRRSLKYGFIITRGRAGSFRKLIVLEPEFDTFKEALDSVLKFLVRITEVINVIVTGWEGIVLNKSQILGMREPLQAHRIVSTWAVPMVA